VTFSLVARCKDTGMFGIAISSSSPAVAARCSWATAGVGAVASQNVTDPSLGPATLKLMQNGAGAASALAEITSTAQFIEYRQLLAVDQQGATSIHSGSEALGTVAELATDHAAAAGNLLANTGIPEAMIDAFLSTDGHLGDRMVRALKAALTAGGEAGPVHSAGILLVDNVSWPVAELRCDWTPDKCPIKNVAEAWEVYKPQLADYTQRALDPTKAPSYGVPGNE